MNPGSWLDLWQDPDWIFDWLLTTGWRLALCWIRFGGILLRKRGWTLFMPQPSGIHKQTAGAERQQTTPQLTDWLTQSGWITVADLWTHTWTPVEPVYVTLLRADWLHYFWTISNKGTLMMDVLTLSGESLSRVIADRQNSCFFFFPKTNTGEIVCFCLDWAENQGSG